MNYAIIAAGEGSRLIAEGVNFPKPLVRLGGITLIDRLITVFLKNNASSISIIINNEMSDVQSYVSKLKFDIPFNIIVKTTPSSMHSFFELSKYLHSGKFCLTTIDTVFKDVEFSTYIKEFENDKLNDGMMAVTDFIDDEKPLYVDVNLTDMIINGFNDISINNEKYISGGMYCLTPKALPILEKCLNNNMSRMRNYQRQLIIDGLRLKAFSFNKIVDVDHASDIKKAEEFLFS